MVSTGTVVDVDFDESTMSATVLQKLSFPGSDSEKDAGGRPGAGNDVVQSCEKFFFKVGKSGHVHASFYGNFNEDCPTGSDSADWHGRADKINFSQLPDDDSDTLVF